MLQLGLSKIIEQVQRRDPFTSVIMIFSISPNKKVDQVHGVSGLTFIFKKLLIAVSNLANI